MRYSEIKELFSHGVFGTDTMRIDAEILDPCAYGHKFEVEFDIPATVTEVSQVVTYLRRVGANEITLKWVEGGK